MSKYNRRLLRRSVQEQIDSITRERIGILSSPRQRDQGGNTHFVVNMPGDARGTSAFVVDATDNATLEQSIAKFPPEAFLGQATKEQVFKAICEERERQDAKWGTDRAQSLAGFLLVMESELDEAKRGWQKNLPGKSAPLNEIVQLAAVCFACLEAYGLTGNAFATADIPDPQSE